MNYLIKVMMLVGKKSFNLQCWRSYLFVGMANNNVVNHHSPLIT